MAAPTALTKKTTGFRGVALTEAAGDQIDKTNGNTFANHPGGTLLIVHNAHATDTITMAIDTPGVVAAPGGAGSPLTVENPSVAVLALTSKVVGPFSKDFQDASGLVTLTFTGTPAVTDVHINVVDMPTY